MKQSVLLPLFCALILSAFSGRTQEKTRESDPIFKTSVFPLPDIHADTAEVPALSDVPTFSNYNVVYKQRLDSIQKTVPLAYNACVQKYIDIYSNRKDMIGKMLGLSDYYFPIFEQALKSYNIPEEIKYLPVIESAMNPLAVSRVGATGLWQFMFTTAKGYGLSIDNFVDERRDPVRASYAAAAYFSDAYTELGDWLLCLAAYNCGMGNVTRAMTKAKSRDFWEIRPYLPLETRNYVPAFIAAMYVMNYARVHQISSQQASLPLDADTLVVNHFVSLPLLAKALDVEETAICSLNPSYKKKIVNGTTELPKRIVLPKAGLENFDRLYEALNNVEMERPTKILLASNSHHRSKMSARPSIVYHKVSSGQNLSSIAQKYNVEVQDLKAWNKLKGNSIVPGQRLIVSKSSIAAKRLPHPPSKQYISYRESSASQGATGKM